jgi:hypothetical protein
MRNVILTREGEELFNGYIIDYTYNFNLGGLDEVNVQCADRFYVLSQTYMDTFNVSEELANVRVEAVLDLPEVNAFQLPGERNIEASALTLGGTGVYTVPNGTSVAAYMAKINEAVQGRIFVARDGTFTFQDRIGTTLSASVADFHDDGTQIPFDQVGISFEANEVVNRASVSLPSGSPEVAEDLASQATYFIQTTSISDCLLNNNTAAQDLAAYLLVAEPTPRYTSVSTPFSTLTDAQRDIVAVIEIGNTITVEKSFATTGLTTTQLAQELAVEGIQHQINALSGHRITLFTSPTSLVFELILDDLIYGTLDELNALG